MTTKYFFETVGTIEDGVGFAHFDTCHLLWLIGFVIFAVVMTLVYCRLGEKARKRMMWIFTALLIADEMWKWTWLFITGTATPNYLPFHLCSINIFLITAYTIKPTRAVGNFLYMAGIPAALIALITPTWTELPFLNFMHLHSFTVHILLATYPIMLTLAGDIKPKLRDLPRTLLLLIGLAGVALIVNLIFDTNFMFLMEPEKGTPFVWFEKNMGSYLLAFPILLIPIIFVMYLPIYLIERKAKKESEG